MPSDGFSALVVELVELVFLVFFGLFGARLRASFSSDEQKGLDKQFIR